MPTRRYRGLSLIEVMLGLAITAMMYAAITAAIQTGSRVTSANQDFFRATQSGRVGLSYMTRCIRQSVPDPLGAGAPEEDAHPYVRLAVSEMVGGALMDVAYEFAWDEKVGGRVTLTKTYPGKSPEAPVVLARNVQHFECRRQAGRDDQNTLLYANFQVSMTVTGDRGHQPVNFSESVVPRRAMALR